MRDVSEQDFNSSLENGTAQIHLFRGRTAAEIRKRVQEHLRTEKTDSVVVLGGGNDLSTSKTPDDIAETLVNIGTDCVNTGVPANKVHISSVLPRDCVFLQAKRKKINDLLRSKCEARNFIFIENDNIILSRHIRRDGVHLNSTGTTKLANNFLSVLNGNNVRKEERSVSVTSDRSHPDGGV